MEGKGVQEQALRRGAMAMYTFEGVESKPRYPAFTLTCKLLLSRDGLLFVKKYWYNRRNHPTSACPREG